MFEVLDRIMNLDIGRRGVDKLYEPARALTSEPLCAAAAKRLMGLAPGDCVFITTGSLTRPWVSPKIGETDGPVGVAALGRSLSYGFNAIPVIITDTSLLEPVGETVSAAGQAIVTLQEAKRATANIRFCSVAVMCGFPIADAEARADAKRLLDDFQPKTVMSVERAGMTSKGTYHNMLGQDFTEGRARIDHVVREASARRIPTIGVGDGGNEIGMGCIAEAVRVHIPYGDIICPELGTDVLLPAGVSNWGCYAIQAALAIMTARPEILHTAALEKRLIEAAANAGLVDGVTGKCEPTVDGLPLEVHMGIVELLAATAKGALKKAH